MHIVVTAQIPTRQNRPQNHMPHATPYHIARHNPHTAHPLPREPVRQTRRLRRKKIGEADNCTFFYNFAKILMCNGIMP